MIGVNEEVWMMLQNHQSSNSSQIQAPALGTPKKVSFRHGLGLQICRVYGLRVVGTLFTFVWLGIATSGSLRSARRQAFCLRSGREVRT